MSWSTIEIIFLIIIQAWNYNLIDDVSSCSLVVTILSYCEDPLSTHIKYIIYYCSTLIYIIKDE